MLYLQICKIINNNTMKKIILSFILIIFSLGIFAQSNYYFPIEVGTVLTYKMYNEKGKLSKEMPWITYTVKNVEKKGNTTHIYFSINWKDQEKMLKELPAEYQDIFENMEVKIENDMMYMEFINSVMSKVLTPFANIKNSNATITTTGDTKNVIPVNMQIGTSIPETNMKMTIKMNMQGMNMSMTNTTRTYDSKVIAKEDITTPAGTFSCFKITNKSEVAMDMGMMKQKEVETQNQWLAKNIGFVKVETFDSKGKLKSYMVLEKIEKK